MDRETAITHLQIIHTWAEFARERDLQFFTAKHLEDIARWADDALAMLKEQESKWIHRADMDYKDKNGVVHFHGMCGNCGFIHDFIDGHTGQYKFCPECGQAVKWEAEDEQARAQGGE